MAKQLYTTAHQETGTCYCPACKGLQCLERPRFIPGQLLSDTDLNDQLAYLLEKNRLHNRYLHGWGVVCGLEVVCNDCDGVVTVKSGYAIDPCGNDIIVCGEQDFNLIAHIRDICNQSRRQRRTDCVPPRPPAKEICKEVEQTWCITLRYKEQEARPITTLHRQTNPCGCGCNGSGKKAGCGCGCHSSRGGVSSSPGSSVAVKSGVGTTVAACQPSRIFESYEVGACLAPAGMCDLPHWDERSGFLGILTQLFGDETMLGRILACMQSLLAHLTKRVPLLYFTNLATVGLTRKGVSDVQPAQQYQIYCSVLQAVLELYENDPFNTRCALPETLAKLTCPQPGDNESRDEFAQRLFRPIMDLSALLVQYAIDCVCKALLPPCPADPGDDALILACVTVKDNKILRICNFCGRTYAGSLPAMKYWFSLTPLISYFTEWLCCRPDLLRAQSPLVNDLTSWLEKLDPDGGIRKALAEGDFALPRMYAEQVGSVIGQMLAVRPLEAIRPNGINLATTVNQPIDKVREELARNQVTIVEQEVKSRREMAKLQNLTLRPFAAPGETVVAYRLGDKVIGYGPHKSTRITGEVNQGTAGTASHDDELRALRQELASLRQEVASLSAKGRRSKG